jgi:hypothetical protein
MVSRLLAVVILICRVNKPETNAFDYRKDMKKEGQA